MQPPESISYYFEYLKMSYKQLQNKLNKHNKSPQDPVFQKMINEINVIKLNIDEFNDTYGNYIKKRKNGFGKFDTQSYLKDFNNYMNYNTGLNNGSYVRNNDFVHEDTKNLNKSGFGNALDQKLTFVNYDDEKCFGKDNYEVCYRQDKSNNYFLSNGASNSQIETNKSKKNMEFEQKIFKNKIKNKGNLYSKNMRETITRRKYKKRDKSDNQLKTRKKRTIKKEQNMNVRIKIDKKLHIENLQKKSEEGAEFKINKKKEFEYKNKYTKIKLAVDHIQMQHLKINNASYNYEENQNEQSKECIDENYHNAEKQNLSRNKLYKSEKYVINKNRNDHENATISSSLGLHNSNAPADVIKNNNAFFPKNVELNNSPLYLKKRLPKNPHHNQIHTGVDQYDKFANKIFRQSPEEKCNLFLNKNSEYRNTSQSNEYIVNKKAFNCPVPNEYQNSNDKIYEVKDIFKNGHLSSLPINELRQHNEIFYNPQKIYMSPYTTKNTNTEGKTSPKENNKNEYLHKHLNQSFNRVHPQGHPRNDIQSPYDDNNLELYSNKKSDEQYKSNTPINLNYDSLDNRHNLNYDTHDSNNRMVFQNNEYMSYYNNSVLNGRSYSSYEGVSKYPHQKNKQFSDLSKSCDLNEKSISQKFSPRFQNSKNLMTSNFNNPYKGNSIYPNFYQEQLQNFNEKALAKNINHQNNINNEQSINNYNNDQIYNNHNLIKSDKFADPIKNKHDINKKQNIPLKDYSIDNFKQSENNSKYNSEKIGKNKTFSSGNDKIQEQINSPTIKLDYNVINEDKNDSNTKTSPNEYFEDVSFFDEPTIYKPQKIQENNIKIKENTFDRLFKKYNLSNESKNIINEVCDIFIETTCHTSGMLCKNRKSSLLEIKDVKDAMNIDFGIQFADRALIKKNDCDAEHEKKLFLIEKEKNKKK
ncbi:hypothetical protein COBT_000358 [Conglomerata obtusa]